MLFDGCGSFIFVSDAQTYHIHKYVIVTVIIRKEGVYIMYVCFSHYYYYNWKRGCTLCMCVLAIITIIIGRGGVHYVCVF